MICHAKYNRSIYDKHFIQDYKLIVSVRDPVSWMQSAIHYFMYDLRYVKKMVSSMFRHLHNKTLGYDDSNTLSICTGNPWILCQNIIYAPIDWSQEKVSHCPCTESTVTQFSNVICQDFGSTNVAGKFVRHDILFLIKNYHKYENNF